jgi:hypothetical protein
MKHYAVVNMQKILYIICLLAILTTTVSADEKNMTLEGMTGGMSTDAKGLLFEILQWVIAIALIACAVRAISGFFSGNPDHTKQGMKGIFYIVAVVLLYYAATFAIAFVKSTYGV